MTSSINHTMEELDKGDVSFDVISAEIGPESLESFYEYNLAASGVAYTLKKMDMQIYDGVLLACFGDPGLYGLKESLSCPVVGIAEASLSMSLLLGYKFAIIVSLQKAVPMMINMVHQYGLGQRMAGVFPLNMPVLDLEKDKVSVIEKIRQVSRKAIIQGAETLILGCAGMTGIAKEVEKEMKVPVIDPVSAGFHSLKAIIESKLTTARHGLYEPVPAKRIIGAEGRDSKYFGYF